MLGVRERMVGMPSLTALELPRREGPRLAPLLPSSHFPPPPPGLQGSSSCSLGVVFRCPELCRQVF